MREAARREAKIVCVNFLSAGWASDTRAEPDTQCCARCVFLFCYFPFMVVGGGKSVFVLVEKSWIWQRTDLSDLFFVKNGKRVWEGRKNACRTTYRHHPKFLCSETEQKFGRRNFSYLE